MAWPLGMRVFALPGIARAALRVLASLVLVLLFGQSTWAKGFHFNPASCKHDTGNMYVALGWSVFVVPTPAQADSVVDPQPDLPHPKPPDPDAPIGCFGNPLQSRSFGLLWSARLDGHAPENTKLGVPDLLELISLYNGNSERTQGGTRGQKSLERKIAEATCRRATVREDLPNGLVACRIKPVKPENAPRKDWAASYIAKTDAYTTPLGRKFVVNCDPGLFSTGIGYCQVNYEYNNDIDVWYKFSPYNSAHPISIDHIIAFDRSLRTAIEAAMVKGYPWSK